MHTSRLAFFAAAICISAGCGSSDEPASTTADSATTADSVAGDTATADTGSAGDTAIADDTGMTPTDTATAGDAPAACTPIANVGGTVMKTTVAGPPPKMTGGTIVPGTYVLTKFELYSGGTGTSSHKETMEFGASTMTNAVSTDGGADKPSFFTYATAGDTLTLSATCGKMGMLPLKYSATATQFVLVAPTNPNQVQTYTKK